MSMQLRSACLLLVFSTFLPATGNGEQKSVPSSETIRELRHEDPQWLLVQPHLPSPVTATPQVLEMAGDVLRARRFPEDALEYYNYALQKGGQEGPLMNKLGVTELEMHNTVAARIYFQRLVRLLRKDAQGWNNLGAVECLDGNYGRAISDYNRAIKLDKTRDKASAAYHSNLGAALIEEKDFKGARQQYEIALRLDPEMADHSGGMGMTARMLSPEELSFPSRRSLSRHAAPRSLPGSARPSKLTRAMFLQALVGPQSSSRSALVLPSAAHTVRRTSTASSFS